MTRKQMEEIYKKRIKTQIALYALRTCDLLLVIEDSYSAAAADIDLLTEAMKRQLVEDYVKRETDKNEDKKHNTYGI